MNLQDCEKFCPDATKIIIKETVLNDVVIKYETTMNDYHGNLYVKKVITLSESRWTSAERINRRLDRWRKKNRWRCLLQV